MYSVVVVEDSKLLRQGLMLTFDWKEHSCYIAGAADNGSDGFELVKEIEPDIVITDIRMPGMDGLEMIEALREYGNQSSYIIISAYNEFEYAKRAIRYGVSEFLVKPFEMTELTRALHTATEKANRQRQMRQLDEKRIMLFGDFLAGEGSMQEKYVENAVKYISEHYAENITISDIAAANHISESHLSRLFKEHLGYAPGEYIAHYRISVACELLKDTNKRIAESAEAVGYKDQRYFSVVFKRIVGVTPHEFRNRSIQ